MQQITKAIIELEGAKRRLQQVHFIGEYETNKDIERSIMWIEAAIDKIKKYEKRETIETN